MELLSPNRAAWGGSYSASSRIGLPSGHRQTGSILRKFDTTVETQAEDLEGGKLDFHSNLPLVHVIAIDRQLPITIVTGVHAGCYELFAHQGIRGIADLKGKSVGGDALALVDRSLC